MEVGGRRRRRRWRRRWWRRSEEVAEYVGVGKKNYEEPGPHGSAGDFLLDEEMEGDPPGREVVEVGGIDVLLEINDSNNTTKWCGIA